MIEDFKTNVFWSFLLGKYLKLIEVCRRKKIMSRIGNKINAGYVATQMPQVKYIKEILEYRTSWKKMV